MKAYPRRVDESGLEALPPLVGTPGYRIIRGSPRAAIRVDVGSDEAPFRTGIWDCSEGAFECVERGDELQTIVRGRLRIVEADGSAHEFGPGDSFVTRRGETLVWDVIEPVRKIFFTYNEGSQAASNPSPTRIDRMNEQSHTTASIVDGYEMTFDPGDPRNGSLYLAEPRDGDPVLDRTETLFQMRLAGLWSDAEERQVPEAHRAAYKKEIQLSAVIEYETARGRFMIARFDHPKFPSDGARWDDWVRFFDGRFERLSD